MPPSFFDKFKQSTGKAGHQISLASRIAKLKVEIATQNSEKDRHLKTIGEKTYGIFARDKRLDGANVETEISNELSLIERIDSHIKDLQDEISALQAEFRNTENNVVDATDVKETDSPSDSSSSN